VPLSLAPLKYASVYAERGGPIGKVSVGESRLFGGRRVFNASARLRDDLRPKGLFPLALYGDEEGSGTDASRTVACYKAVSEAIERWAFYASVEGPMAERLGFVSEPTTTGMAAFPGLTSRAARSVALSEAVERWAVLEWWRGRLPAKRRASEVSGLESLEILVPFKDRSVAVIWTVGAGCSGAAYGFAGGTGFAAARDKALIELSRNQNVLSRFEKAGVAAAAPQVSLERRLLHFSRADGMKEFLERVARSAEAPGAAGPAPRRLVDAEVPGPWSRFASVWRVLFEHRDGPDDRTADGVFRF
jgi:hypothetical protein